MKRIFLGLATIFILILYACGQGPAPAPEPSSTPLPPTLTPEPPTATATAVPTDTPTRLPTDTPTITPTPGPVSITDDFSTKSDIWEDCDNCEWKDGQLLLGPYPAGSDAGENLNFIVCTGCGNHKYYRVAVDVTFVDGQVDRFFGILAPMSFGSEGEYIRLFYMGLSPWQVYTIRDYNFDEQMVKRLAYKDSAGIVKPGKATNRLEVTVTPGKTDSTVDVTFRMNDKTLYTYPNLALPATWVGLGMSFHSTTVAYDNFEYEEITK
jgi:hypothetical protein